MKSPLDGPPLRNPGQKLDEDIRDYFDDSVAIYLVASGFIIVAAMTEWIYWYRESPPNPTIITITAILVITFSAWKIKRALKKINALKLGRDGEKSVGQKLEELRENGAMIFHDIQANGFNLDHVAITKSGIFVIETKSYSKPSKGKTEIVFNGKYIFRNGVQLDSNPIIQVKAAANWLKKTLKESTGKHFNIQPVILFPGWYIESTPEAKKSGVWVLNPKALPTYIANNKQRIDKEDVYLASYHLSCYVKTFKG